MINTVKTSFKVFLSMDMNAELRKTLNVGPLTLTKLIPWS
jgi:hypothetical protein